MASGTERQRRVRPPLRRPFSAQVADAWAPLSDAALDHADVPGLNSPFDVLAEAATARLGAGSLSAVFPGVTPSPLGLFRTS